MYNSPRFILRAQNVYGCPVSFDGDTIKEAINKFDSEFIREGFKIYIDKLYSNRPIEILKKTFK